MADWHVIIDYEGSSRAEEKTFHNLDEFVAWVRDNVPHPKGGGMFLGADTNGEEILVYPPSEEI